MSKISGIKTVDFIVCASGEGVVNHNGAMSVYNPSAGQTIKNHLFPKLRGVDPMRKVVKDGDKVMGMSLADPDLATAALVVSASCIRSHLFKGVSFGVAQMTRNIAGDALASLLGLMRGYLITDGGANFPRKSPLHITDFECAKPGLRYNQGSKACSHAETSLHSNFATDKDLQYVGKGSISIEDLQFIPLENTHGRSSYSEAISMAEGLALSEHVTQYLQDISGREDAKAEFVTNAVRTGTFVKEGEAGLLLNDAAMDVAIQETLELLRTLYVRQAKGFLRVDEVLVDYNTGHAFRILKDPSVAVTEKREPYAMYYCDGPLTPSAFEQKMKNLAERIQAEKAARREKRAARAKRADAGASAPSTDE